MMAEQTAEIIEIFSSIQGEGKYAGCRQVFVRFTGCNLACSYCDTANTAGGFPECRIETEAGSQTFRTLANPLTVNAAAEAIETFLAEMPHQAVSFTGGEPLLHAPFLRAVAERLQADYPDVAIFLETNGTLYRQLAEVLDIVDIISMDIKMPGETGEHWAEHEAFLRLARLRDVCLKVVLTADTPLEDIKKAAGLAARMAPQAMFVLQPVTPYNGCAAPTPQQVTAAQQAALAVVSDVRVLPQTHRLLAQL